jgi:putative nucleotidyltransferase with HDIG domain
MSVVTQDREQIVANAIREISHIATLPEITVKVVELVEDPKSTAQDLHKVISSDPALCSRILKVVNSSFYGLPGQIGSINRAIVMLGLNAVKNIAIAASLAKLFRGGDLTPNFSARVLWTHSVATAAAAKVLCDKLGFAFSDEAFLSGLMHDIGLMVEMQFDRNRLVEVLQRVGASKDGVPSADMLAIEEEVFGATHQHFGAGLCEKWKFPKSFTYVTGHHHKPLELPPENRTVACIVYVAERLIAQVAPTFRLDLPSTEIDPAVMESLKLSGDKLAEIRNSIPVQLMSVESLRAYAAGASRSLRTLSFSLRAVSRKRDRLFLHTLGRGPRRPRLPVLPRLAPQNQGVPGARGPAGGVAHQRVPGGRDGLPVVRAVPEGPAPAAPARPDPGPEGLTRALRGGAARLPQVRQPGRGCCPRCGGR